MNLKTSFLKLAVFFGNLIFMRCQPIYRILYFGYKKISDRDLILKMEANIKPGMIALDIGGNIGFYSKLIAKLVGENGQLHVFEPDELNFKFLKEEMSGYKQVFLNNCAVGESSGTIDLYKSDKSNADHRTYPSESHVLTNKIECINLDEYLAKRNIQQVYFVKIDIQGFDYFALKGMVNILKKSSAVTIVGEYWPYGLDLAGVEPNKYIQFLKDLEFQVCFFGDQSELGFKPVQDQYLYCNFLASKK